MYVVPLFQSPPKRIGFASGGHTYMCLAWAYWQAGQTLLGQTDPAESVVVRIPAAYLYRHAVELSIKGILAEVGAGDEKIVVNRGHKLSEQAEDLRNADKASGVLPADMEDLLEEIDRIDPDGARLKYPKDRKLVQYAELDFDVNSFKQNGDRLIEKLIALYEGISANVYADILRKEGVPR